MYLNNKVLKETVSKKIDFCLSSANRDTQTEDNINALYAKQNYKELSFFLEVYFDNSEFNHNNEHERTYMLMLADCYRYLEDCQKSLEQYEKTFNLYKDRLSEKGKKILIDQIISIAEKMEIKKK